MLLLPAFVLKGNSISWRMAVSDNALEYNWIPRNIPLNRSDPRAHGASPKVKAGFFGG